MRTCDLHRRRHLLASLLTLACLALSANRAAGQAYTQTSQTRSMRAEVTARVPGRPDVTDVRTEESMQLGSFDRAILASAMANEQGASASVAGHASQRITFLPESISGLLQVSTATEGIGSSSQGRAHSISFTEFQVNGANDLPYVFSGRMLSLLDPAGGSSAQGLIALADLDTEDPHGGPTIVFFLSQSPGFDSPLDHSGTLLAGHRYSLVAEVIAETALSMRPDMMDQALDAEISFTISVPEPGSTSLWMFATGLLLSRRVKRHC